MPSHNHWYAPSGSVANHSHWYTPSGSITTGNKGWNGNDGSTFKIAMVSNAHQSSEDVPTYFWGLRTETEYTQPSFSGTRTTTENSGSGTAYRQPFFAGNYIIKY